MSQSTIDEALLDERLAALESAREWSPRVVAKLEALLQSADETALVRMNPLAFARERGIDLCEALDLFVHASHLGLLLMEWNLLCPLCGTSVQSFASLRALHSHFYCAMCRLETEANLDDFIQVSFTVAPSVRRLRFHDGHSLSAEDFFYRLRMTREMHFESLEGPRMVDLVAEIVKVLAWIKPGERQAFRFDLPEAGELPLAELQAHTGTFCRVDPEAEATEALVTIGDSTIETSATALRIGEVCLTVENRRPHPVVFVAGFHPLAHLGDEIPPTMLEPIVTGAMLLTNSTFRRLFRSEKLEGQEGIGVRDVTVLFTDLKSSTALYERIGDLDAFSLVQQHFERLASVVQAHGGAMVKTIGDAVMAAFQEPAAAVRAAVEMQAQIDRFNAERGARDIVLKIGVHRGPSIVVTLNDSLDYFGHTVNVAARVQSLADADEIFVTEQVYRAEGVAALLGPVSSREAELRGIAQPVRVYGTARAQA